MRNKIITVIGGTGFLGRYVVKRLAKAGYTIRVICRRPNSALHLKTAGDVGQIVLMSGNLANPESLRDKLANSYAVINLVGVLFESGKQTFTNLHAQGAEKIALMAKEAGAERFIHISALGVDKNTDSAYARSKAVGERAVQSAFPGATILRPSVIFGPEDNFFNQFATMASLSPALPLIGGGKTKFQPVYVDNVAKAIVLCLTQDVQGETFELGGPRTYSFREILEYIMHTIGKKRMLINVPFNVASTMGMGCEILPRPVLTRDQVRLLKHDNVVSPNAKTFAHLGISPAAVEVIVPEYLARYNRKAAA
ncbi:MAG: complex I NDUFA9 subunit family protein [Rickettsiales bacterium]